MVDESATGVAQAEFMEIAWRWLRAQRIDALRVYAQQYPEDLEKAAEAEAERAAAYLKTVFEGTEEEWSELRGEIVATTRQQALASQQAVVKASALVFWHATVDATAYELCLLVGKLDPSKWDDALSGNRIEYREVRESEPGAIRERLLKGFCEKLERQSMLVKLKQLHDMCGGVKTWSWSKLYKFDEAKMAEIDGKRHEMVHGDGLSAAHELSEDDLDYLKTTSLYLLNLVAYSFSLKLFGRVPKTIA